MEGSSSKKSTAGSCWPEVGWRPDPRCNGGEHWLKVKCVQVQELVIVGYVPSIGGAEFVGSLVLCHYENGRLTYAGRVGTGWSRDVSRSLRDAIETSRVPRPPLCAAASAVVAICAVYAVILDYNGDYEVPHPPTDGHLRR
jgi:ATP-dependent DNA ligase